MSFDELSLTDLLYFQGAKTPFRLDPLDSASRMTPKFLNFIISKKISYSPNVNNVKLRL